MGNKLKKPSALDNAVKIKCCYCEINETCIRRNRKEDYEEKGMMSYCQVTPNRPQSFKKKKKKSVK